MQHSENEANHWSSGLPTPWLVVDCIDRFALDDIDVPFSSRGERRGPSKKKKVTKPMDGCRDLDRSAGWPERAGGGAHVLVPASRQIVAGE